MQSFRKLTMWGFALVAILLLFMLFPSSASPIPYGNLQRYASAEGFDAEDNKVMMNEIGNLMATPESFSMGGNLGALSESFSMGGNVNPFSESFNMRGNANAFAESFAMGGNLNSISESFNLGGISFGGNMRAFSEGFEPIAEKPKTLYSGPLRDSEIIDKFSQVNVNGIEGEKGCVSSGLTNSGGYICLTPELIQLMTTRGGNATGRDFQVGAPASK